MHTLRRRLFSTKAHQSGNANLSVGRVQAPLGELTYVSGSGNTTTNTTSANTSNHFTIENIIIGVPLQHTTLDESLTEDGSRKVSGLLSIDDVCTSLQHSFIQPTQASPVSTQGETASINGHEDEEDNGDSLGALKPLPKNNFMRSSFPTERRGNKRRTSSELRLSINSDVCSTRNSIHSVIGRKPQMKRRVAIPLSHCAPVTFEDVQLPDTIHQDIKAYMCSSRFSEAPDLFLQSDYTICLWNPYHDISLDRQLQEKHCILGDVGTFNSEGGFNVMFNIFMSMEENFKMNYRPPKTFVPIQADDYVSLAAQRPTPKGHGYYMSENFVRQVEETGTSTYTFESTTAPTKPGGAILVLPEGCSKRKLPSVIEDQIESYLGIHAESWYDPDSYPNKLRALPNGSLQLIHTCYQSSLWAAAVLPNKRYRPGMSYARLKRSTTSPRFYEWDECYRKSILVNTGSSKENVEDLCCTIAVEVYSIYHDGPEIEILSPVNNRRSHSAFSFKSKISKSFASMSRIVYR